MHRAQCLILLIALAVLCSCSAAGTGSGADKTLTFYSDPALDGAITCTGASSYTWAPGATFVSIGDDTLDNTIRCLISFDVHAIATGTQIDSAIVSVYQNDQHPGDSYLNSSSGGLGQVLIDRIEYTLLTSQADLYGPQSLESNFATLSASYAQNTWHEFDITSRVQNEVDTPTTGRLQFRLYHNITTNHDLAADADGWVMGDSPTHRPELVIKLK
jgi:hypothetical protein